MKTISNQNKISKLKTGNVKNCLFFKAYLVKVSILE